MNGFMPHLGNCDRAGVRSAVQYVSDDDQLEFPDEWGAGDPASERSYGRCSGGEQGLLPGGDPIVPPPHRNQAAQQLRGSCNVTMRCRKFVDLMPTE